MTGRPEEQQRLIQEWLVLAEEDLLLAQELHDNSSSHLRAICFHSQQAAEKFLKALLASKGISFERTHDIENLVNHLPPELADPLRTHNILDLTEYAVETSYPSHAAMEIDQTDADRAVASAHLVAEHVRKFCQSKNKPPDQTIGS